MSNGLEVYLCRLKKLSLNKNQIQMKKFYSLIAVALFVTVTSFGQFAAIPAQKTTRNASNEIQIPKLVNQSAARHVNPNNTASIIWSDDFSNASNWNTTHPIGTSDWVIGTNGPSGPFAIPAITSTTAANGFAMFDSDNLCDQTNGQIGDLTNATPINCTGHTAIRLNFQESYCRYWDSTLVFVSNNGTTWTRFDVNANLANNDYAGGGTASTGATVNPYNVSLNISSVAANQATVYIRFEFYSPTSLGPNAGCAYAWMVDDVVIEDAPTDDVAMEPGFLSPYTMIPLAQAIPVDLAGMITNNGGNPATNVGFNANVYLFQGGIGWSQVFNGSSATAPSLTVGSTTAALSAGLFNFTDTGVYAFEFISFMDAADGDGSNDTTLSYIIVDDSSYARDYQPISGNCDAWYGAPSGSTVAFGNMYDINAAATVKSVTFVHAFATLGGQIRADIYDVVGGAPNAIIASSPVYAYSVDDTSSQFYFILTLPLTTPVAVGPGQIFVSLTQVDPSGTMGENNMGLGFTDNVFTGASAFIQVDTDPFDSNENFGLIGVFAIRPNFDLNDRVISSDFTNGISIYPNPSNGKLYIHNSGQKDNLTVTVFNSLGQSVFFGTYSQMSTTVIDLTAQASGVYSVQVKSDKDVITKSVVISNK